MEPDSTPVGPVLLFPLPGASCAEAMSDSVQTWFTLRLDPGQSSHAVYVTCCIAVQGVRHDTAPGHAQGHNAWRIQCKPSCSGALVLAMCERGPTFTAQKRSGWSLHCGSQPRFAFTRNRNALRPRRHQPALCYLLQRKCTRPRRTHSASCLNPASQPLFHRMRNATQMFAGYWR